jgi:hypothetical protein
MATNHKPITALEFKRRIQPTLNLDYSTSVRLAPHQQTWLKNKVKNREFFSKSEAIRYYIQFHINLEKLTEE